MTIEERLNEIVEKGQGDAIIPFLQGLTQEERKTLVPCLNKLEEHYNKFVQLNENTYGCLLYTSDAADDLLCEEFGGRRIIKKKKKREHETGSEIE